MFQIENQPLSIRPQVLGYLGDFPISDTLTSALLVFLFFLILAFVASRFRVFNPGKFQLAIEELILAISKFIERIVGDSKIASKVMPLVISLIFFLISSNLILTIFPFLSGITYNGQTLFRTHTNDFNTTLSLAVGVVFLTQIYSIQNIGFINYFSKFIQLKQIIQGFMKGLKEGMVSIINCFVGLLEIISEFAKVISMSLRLFGNMFAGELLLGIFMGMFAIFVPIPILGLSLLSGLVQAVVFGSLAAAYFTAVLKGE